MLIPERVEPMRWSSSPSGAIPPLDLRRLNQEMQQPIIVDLHNIYLREDVESLGFTYESVGRSAARKNHLG